MSKEFWFKEYHSPDHGLFFRIDRVIFQKRSEFQQIDIVESPTFGKVLILDGLVMTTDLDEFVYHEMLVHPAMTHHPDPSEILVIGGGDGGTVREILKYPVVKEIVVCEIDRAVVEASSEFLPHLSKGFNDQKVKLIFEDGVKFVQRETAKRYDVIFVDSSDPVGPAAVLYGTDFIENLKRILKDGGIVVFQSESPFTRLHIIKDLFNKLRGNFPYVSPYLAPMPGYPDGTWSFLMASHERYEDPVRNCPGNLKYYNSEIDRASRVLPNFIRSGLYG